jgi:hypothetical protein
MSSTEKKTPARRRTPAAGRSTNGTPAAAKTATGTAAKPAAGAAARPRATRARTRTPALESPFAPSHEDIQRRAYEIFLSSGAQPGHDVEHWLQAERELARRV